MCEHVGIRHETTVVLGFRNPTFIFTQQIKRDAVKVFKTDRPRPTTGPTGPTEKKMKIKSPHGDHVTVKVKLKSESWYLDWTAVLLRFMHWSDEAQAPAERVWPWLKSKYVWWRKVTRFWLLGTVDRDKPKHKLTHFRTLESTIRAPWAGVVLRRSSQCEKPLHLVSNIRVLANCFSTGKPLAIIK